jgi:hypothetical protein
MPHTATRTTFRVFWALALGLTASALVRNSAAAEPSTTPDTSNPVVSVPAIRDQWYLDLPAPGPARSIAAESRDSWYLEFRPSAPAARSHRDQEES